MNNSKYYKIFGYVVIVLGVIGSIICSMKLGKVSLGYYSERNWGVTIMYFLCGTITSALFGSILIGIGSTMEAVDDLRYDVDRYGNHEVDAKEACVDDSHIWTCTSCGTRNHITSAACGKCGCDR